MNSCSELIGTPINWLFIIGNNNGGTTLLHHLLGQHSCIDYLPREGGDYYSPMTPGYWPSEYKDSLDRVFGEKMSLFANPSDPPVNCDAEELKSIWLNMRIKKTGKYIMEKTPSDCVRVPWLVQHFYPAKLIVITRQPYAVVEGIRRKKGCSLDRAINHVLLSYTKMIMDLTHYSHIKISYEGLCERPELVLHALEEYLNISYQDWSWVTKHKFHLGVSHIPDNKLENMNNKSKKNLTLEEWNKIHHILRPILQQMDYNEEPYP